ncbi:hypothetical protein HYT55_00110 [Candidatus Woesearchaeota archaeon]|nr:hypothetical protein [Candidatus Woesearchaeota archaeon]
MQEKMLFRISLLVTVVGLLLLFVFSEETSTPTLDSIEQMPQSKPIRMEGVVTKLVKKDTVYFATLDSIRHETTEIIIFPEEEIFLKEGNIVVVQGTTQKYKGENEIIASKIEVKGELPTSDQ